MKLILKFGLCLLLISAVESGFAQTGGGLLQKAKGLKAIKGKKIKKNKGKGKKIAVSDQAKPRDTKKTKALTAPTTGNGVSNK